MYSWEEFDKRKGNYWRICNKMRRYRQRKPRRRLHTAGKLVTIPMRCRQGGSEGPAPPPAGRRPRRGMGGARCPPAAPICGEEPSPKEATVMAKIVIVGSGPAGVSAALYAARAGMDTTVISMGPGALQKAEQIQNYYGLEKPLSGMELYRRGIAGAKAVGAKFVTAEVVGLDYAETLVVQTTGGEYPADAVILAAGTSRLAPRIEGLREHEGHGVSYCATCDAFFYKDKTAAVLGSGEYALHEVQALLPLAGKVILCTNGEKPTAQFPPQVMVCREKLAAVEGEGTVRALRLENGEALAVDGLFVAIGVAGSVALARKLGAPVEGSRIVVDERMQTGIPGLYAAGDCTGGLLQICKAVYEGALAATEAIGALRRSKQ